MLFLFIGGTVLWGLLYSGTAMASSVGSTPTPAEPGSDLTYEFGVATWLSEGRTEWNHDASASGLLGNPTSELTYKKVDSHVLEFHGKALVEESFFIKGTFGYGMVDDGTLVDDDYVSSFGSTFYGTSVSGSHRFSRTDSQINDGELWYVTMDLGMPVASLFDGALTVDGYMGFQHWREKYVAQGVLQVECTAIGVLCNAPGTLSFVGQDVITNTVDWDSVRVGVDAAMSFWDRLSVYANGVVIPYTNVEGEDIHHLRTDLRKDPSFTLTGTGWGYQLEGGVGLRISGGVFVTAGYRYWRLTIENGEWRNHPTNSAPSTFNLNDYDSTRHGATFGVVYRF